MSKGPTAFRTISEVAEELDLPQHVLRFWETRFAQIKPMKRGGGRRYYRPDDIDLLRGIRHLLYGEGYTIRGVQRILKEHGARFVTGAGREEVPVLSAAPADLEPPPLDEDVEDEAVAVGPDLDRPQVDEAPDHVEPTFSGGAFRPQPRPVAPSLGQSIYAKPAAPGLAGDDIDRLQATLGQLMELKRLLDGARG